MTHAGRAARQAVGAAGGAAARAGAARAPGPAAAAAAAPAAEAAPAAGTGSCSARKPRPLLKDRFRDRTGRDRQGRSSLALQNRTFHLVSGNKRGNSP